MYLFIGDFEKAIKGCTINLRKEGKSHLDFPKKKASCC